MTYQQHAISQFINRKDAGRQLAAKLLHLKASHPAVIALPRGGVPVAAEIAQQLATKISVLLVRKLGAPNQPELALGAISEDNCRWLNNDLINYFNVSEADLAKLEAAEMAKIQRQKAAFGLGDSLPDLRDRTAILVDDGLATGATMLAAVNSLKLRGAQKIAVAVPVAAAGRAADLRKLVNEVIAVIETDALLPVGSWYQDFSQIEDAEVRSILTHTSTIQRNTHR